MNQSYSYNNLLEPYLVNTCVAWNFYRQTLFPLNYLGFRLCLSAMFGRLISYSKTSFVVLATAKFLYYPFVINE
jgi:hypothetical protein